MFSCEMAEKTLKKGRGTIRNEELGMKNGKSTKNGSIPHSSSPIPELSKDEVLADYRICHQSRQASVLGRREVLTGKAKFGIFGDGKEVAQIAMSKVFRNGDFRSGYYRDQTFMLAIGALTLQQWFAGLYGHTDIEREPMSAGRQ